MSFSLCGVGGKYQLSSILGLKYSLVRFYLQFYQILNYQSSFFLRINFFFFCKSVTVYTPLPKLFH
jgi:hypothetical protein